MFLFEKRTKKVIKWFWGVFAVLVGLSMIFTYSGFTMLAGTTGPSTTEDIPPEVLAELQAQQEAASSTVELTTGDTNVSEPVEVSTPVIERTENTTTPPPPSLDFGL